MATTTDAVCGMTIEDTADAPRTTYQGRTYVFCSEVCRDRFTADPEFYRAASGSDA